MVFVGRLVARYNAYYGQRPGMLDFLHYISHASFIADSFQSSP